MSINPPDPEVPSGSDPSENPDTPSPYSPEGQQFAASPAATPPPLPAPPSEKPTGGSIWGGVGIGCGGYIALFALIFVPEISGMLFSGSSPGLLVYFAIPAVIGLALIFIPDLRRLGAGVLIAAAASWLIFIGPCIALSGGL